MPMSDEGCPHCFKRAGHPGPCDPGLKWGLLIAGLLLVSACGATPQPVVTVPRVTTAPTSTIAPVTTTTPPPTSVAASSVPPPRGTTSVRPAPVAAPRVAPRTATPSSRRPAPTAQPRVARAPQPVAGPTSFANCAAVRAAGKAPIRRGDPGFREKFDADHDGVGCE